MPTVKKFQVDLASSTKELARIISLLPEGGVCVHAKFLDHEDDQREAIAYRHRISVASFNTDWKPLTLSQTPTSISDKIEIYPGTTLVSQGVVELWGYFHETVFECDEADIEFKYDARLRIWSHTYEDTTLVLWFQ